MSDESHNQTLQNSKNQEDLMEALFTCSSAKCIANGSEKQLQCCNCHQWVHYRCTMLPPYMIQAFIEKRIKKYYYCANCITVPKELEKEVCSKSNEQHEIRRLRKDIQRCENLMRTADENVKSITKKLLSEKADKIDESKIEKMIDSKFEKIEATLFNQQKNVASQSYASVTNSAPQNDFKTIMKMAKLEEIAEERDRRSRENNIIIHGVKEPENETDEEKTFVDKFLTTLEEAEKKPTFIGRIGKKEVDKIRPIKVAFKSENEKKAIFKKLRMLKGNTDFAGVAVAEDFTESERKLLKMWSDKAKERNSEEKSDFVWRVRGSPKSGTMRLKKFPKTPSQ